MGGMTNKFYQELASCIRIEYNEESGDLNLIFKVSDPNFKKLVLNNWTQDIDLILKNKKLFKKDE